MARAAGPVRWWSAIVPGLLDVLLDVACLGCGRPGTSWCSSCVAAAWRPTIERPAGSFPVVSASRYGGAVRRALIAHKDRGQLSLAAPLGLLLGQAARQLAWPGPVMLVPCPSPRAASRRRGQDHSYRLAQAAARSLRRSGLPVTARADLRVARPVRDQVGMAHAERLANVTGAFVGRPPLTAQRPCLVVDDIATTGATVREAHRALSAAGWLVIGAAVVARTTGRSGADISPRTGVAALPPRG